MQKLRVHALSISLDGYAAGPNQSNEEPLGAGGENLHDWLVSTRSWRAMHGMDGGATGIDDDIARRADENIGAGIMGRKMFGPIGGGPWRDDGWRGWWGDDPPYHCDVFVLTHYPRDPMPMQGGTTFHFVTDGIEPALERAFAAAGGKDVRLNGGASVVQQYLAARLIDEMHVAISPVLLGGGERLFDYVGGGLDGYEVAEFVASPAAAHARIVRR